MGISIHAAPSSSFGDNRLCEVSRRIAARSLWFFIACWLTLIVGFDLWWAVSSEEVRLQYILCENGLLENLTWGLYAICMVLVGYVYIKYGKACATPFLWAIGLFAGLIAVEELSWGLHYFYPSSIHPYFFRLNGIKIGSLHEFLEIVAKQLKPQHNPIIMGSILLCGAAVGGWLLWRFRRAIWFGIRGNAPVYLVLVGMGLLAPAAIVDIINKNGALAIVEESFEVSASLFVFYAVVVALMTAHERGSGGGTRARSRRQARSMHSAALGHG